MSVLPFHLLSTAEQKLPKQTKLRHSDSLSVCQAYTSGWQIHDIASPPHDGFAFSVLLYANELINICIPDTCLTSLCFNKIQQRSRLVFYITIKLQLEAKLSLIQTKNKIEHWQSGHQCHVRMIQNFKSHHNFKVDISVP
jgi:hypothetical protein